MKTQKMKIQKNKIKLKLHKFIRSLLVLILILIVCKSANADVQKNKEPELLDSTVLSDNYKEELEDEGKILKGLKRLLELKESVAPIESAESSEFDTKNENLTISKEVSGFGAVLFTVNAKLVAISEILNAVASISGRKLVMDEDLSEYDMSSVISVFLERNPLIDIIDIILGAKGFESIVSDEIIFVTLPSKLEFVSSYEYYQGKAIQAYQRAMIKYPAYKGIARAYYELGNFYFASGFPTIALQEFSVIVQKYKNDPLAKSALFSIGKCYEMLGNIEKAGLAYGHYVKVYPLDTNIADIYLLIGDLLRMQKKYNEAIDIYKKIVNEFPKEDTAKLALMRLGSTYIDSNDYDSALRIFMKTKKIHLGEEFYYEIEYQIGNCYYLMDRYDEAINSLNDFVLYGKDNDLLDDAYYKIADCFFKKKDYLTAFHLYQGALAEFPDSDLAPYGYLYNGKTLRIMNMIESARDNLRKGLVRYSDSAYSENMKFEMGLCYFEDESYNRAFEVFKEIDTEKENLIPGIQQAKIYAGICLSRERKHKKAIEYYIKALSSKGVTEQEKKWIFKLMGDSYTELGELAIATKAYQGEIL